MNYLKFFRRRGFKKISKPNLANEHIAYNQESDWKQYDAESGKFTNAWYKIVRLNNKDLKDNKHKLVISNESYNSLAYDLGNDRIYLFCGNNRHYSLMMVNFTDKYYTRLIVCTLEENGIDNSFDENLKKVIGEGRYRDYAITQLLKKDVKI